jgi:hypothetical protein
MLVRREIERGLMLVDSPIVRNSPRFAQAQRAVTTAAALLPRISALTPEEQSQMDAQINQLRSQLDEAPVAASIPSYRLAAS